MEEGGEQRVQHPDRRQAQAAGFNHHMVKPLDLDALQELLTTLEPHEK